MPETQTGMTMEQAFQLIAKMNEENQKNLLTAITEIRKPSAAEQEKLDKEAKKLGEQQAARLKLAQAEEHRKRTMSAGCAHATTHPGTGVSKHQFRAQVHTPANEPAFFIPTCTQCLSQFPKIKATTEMLTQGVNLDQYAGLNVDTLKTWAAASWSEVAA